MSKVKQFNDAKEYAQSFIQFLNQAYSVFHVSDNCKKVLEAKGYTELKENGVWQLQAGGKYYFQRNTTAILAFAVGSNFDENNTGFKIVASHMDSPCLQLAPISKMKQIGYNQACIQTYGGGLWHTWTDRDLILGGKVIYFDDISKTYKTKLWNSKKPIMKIDNLAIHLQTAQERLGFPLNPETQLRPIISTDVYDPDTSINEKEQNKLSNESLPTSDKHYSRIIELICNDLGLTKESIVDMELQLSDAQPASLFGTNDEFLSSQKIDDLICTFAALKSFEDNQTTNKKFVDMICLFDHEEIGSNSAHGAKSTLISDAILRIMKCLSQNFKVEQVEKAKANSFILSSDVVHSVHPNFLDRYQINHQCVMNKGLNTSYDPRQNFASSLIGRSILYELSRRSNVPIQEFIQKNDQAAGATLGPSLSAMTSIRTADIGPGLIGLHSIRETGGALDAYYNYLYIKGFFDEYEKININSLVYQ